MCKLNLWVKRIEFLWFCSAVGMLDAVACIQLDNFFWGGDIFMFTDRKNNRFQKKLITQNTNVGIYAPPIMEITTA